MIQEESLTELNRLSTEYRRVLRSINRLERTRRTADPERLIELHAQAKDLGNMIATQAQRMNRAVEATTGHIVKTTPHLQEHPRLRKYAPPARQVTTPRPTRYPLPTTLTPRRGK